MAQRKDKDSGLPQTARSSGPTTNCKTERGENQKDPHEYDPGGMAGKKAGIIEDLQEEACEPEHNESKADTSTPNDPSKDPTHR